MNRNEANETRRRTAGIPPVLDPASGGCANGGNRSCSPWFRPQNSTTQRVSTTNIVAAKILYFAVEYVSQARCLNRWTGLVWRIASGILLINTGVAALATGAQPKLCPVLTCGVAIAGKISVRNGRELV